MLQPESGSCAWTLLFQPCYPERDRVTPLLPGLPGHVSQSSCCGSWGSDPGAVELIPGGVYSATAGGEMGAEREHRQRLPALYCGGCQHMGEGRWLRCCLRAVMLSLCSMCFAAFLSFPLPQLPSQRTRCGP